MVAVRTFKIPRVERASFILGLFEQLAQFSGAVENTNHFDSANDRPVENEMFPPAPDTGTTNPLEARIVDRKRLSDPGRARKVEKRRLGIFGPHQDCVRRCMSHGPQDQYAIAVS